MGLRFYFCCAFHINAWKIINKDSTNQGCALLKIAMNTVTDVAKNFEIYGHS